jgi:predicted GIY-YIG superfamily endonuclease
MRRLHQHLEGKTFTTSKMANLSLCGFFLKETKTEAIKLEKMIKRNGHIQHRLIHPTFIKNDGE